MYASSSVFILNNKQIKKRIKIGFFRSKTPLDEWQKDTQSRYFHVYIKPRLMSFTVWLNGWANCERWWWDNIKLVYHGGESHINSIRKERYAIQTTKTNKLTLLGKAMSIWEEQSWEGRVYLGRQYNTLPLFSHKTSAWV